MRVGGHARSSDARSYSSPACERLQQRGGTEGAEASGKLEQKRSRPRRRGSWKTGRDLPAAVSKGAAAATSYYTYK